MCPVDIVNTNIILLYVQAENRFLQYINEMYSVGVLLFGRREKSYRAAVSAVAARPRPHAFGGAGDLVGVVRASSSGPLNAESQQRTAGGRVRVF